MSPEFWITTAAIFAGPIIAVLVTHHLQNRKERSLRRLSVFTSLMATRRTPLSPERVKALNLIEVEFHGKTAVRQQFSQLLKLYNDQASWKSEDPEVRKKILQDVDDQTAKLLKEIGEVLGYNFEGLEILRGGYYPEAFSAVEGQQESIRKFLVGLHEGTHALPTVLIDWRQLQKVSELSTDASPSQSSNGNE